MDDFDDIDAQVKALEAQLYQAKTLRETESRKRREADELQREIEELESQLAQQGLSHPTPECFQTNSSFAVQLNDKPPSQPMRFISDGTRTTAETGHQHRQQPSTIPVSARSQPKAQLQPTAVTALQRPQPEIRNTSQAITTTMAPVVGASEQAKRNHQWSKPDWALPSTALPDDTIQKDSIVNPLLKTPKNTNAYERKVKPKDLELIRGTFVAPQGGAKSPEPRLVWIVVNVDGCKLGKIVMHLAGANIDPIVDVFADLKGLELQRTANKCLVVQDIDPVFTIVSGKTGPGCFGIIQEGRDIFDQCIAASPEAVLTVKQSHIYPVKKAKPII
jgi:hypothetical protein